MSWMDFKHQLPTCNLQVWLCGLEERKQPPSNPAMPKLQPLMCLFNKFPCTSGCLGGALDCLLNCLPALLEELSSAALAVPQCKAAASPDCAPPTQRWRRARRQQFPLSFPAGDYLAGISSHTLQGQAVSPLPACGHGCQACCHCPSAQGKDRGATWLLLES